MAAPDLVGFSQLWRCSELSLTLHRDFNLADPFVHPPLETSFRSSFPLGHQYGVGHMISSMPAFSSAYRLPSLPPTDDSTRASTPDRLRRSGRDTPTSSARRSDDASRTRRMVRRQMTPPRRSNKDESTSGVALAPITPAVGSNSHLYGGDAPTSASTIPQLLIGNVNEQIIIQSLRKEVNALYEALSQCYSSLEKHKKRAARQPTEINDTCVMCRKKRGEAQTHCYQYLCGDCLWKFCMVKVETLALQSQVSPLLCAKCQAVNTVWKVARGKERALAGS